MKKMLVRKLAGIASPDVHKLTDAPDPAEANLDISAEQGKGQDQKQPHTDRSRGQSCGQANCVNRNGGRFGRKDQQHMLC